MRSPISAVTALRRGRALLAAVLAAAVLTAGVSAVGSAPAAAAPTCPAQEAVSGLARDAHPVVLVHGWTGTPLRDTRALLEKKLPKGWQFKLFDYSKVATHWAARPEIAQCLATFLMSVSNAHRSAGGDGKVFVVAHSMGGLATAFAASEEFGGLPRLADRLGGLVTMDTPWTGSVWGDQALSRLAQVQSPGSLFDRLGTLVDTSSDAWKCLRTRANNTKDSSCVTAPNLPKSVPVAQLAGNITVQRHFFGLHAYDIVTGSDGIVSADSQQGYLNAATDSTLGYHVTLPRYDCSVSMNAVLDALPRTAGKERILGELSQLPTDSAAMDALGSDSATAALAWFTLGILFTSPCSHVNVGAQDEAAHLVAAALREQARPSLQVTDALNAPIPADCQHAAGRLTNGKMAGLAPSAGFATVSLKGPDRAQLVDVTGDGQPELISVLSCSAGGVGWPQRLLVYTPGPKLLGSLSLGDLVEAEHSQVQSMTSTGSGVKVRWVSYTGAGFAFSTWSGELRWSGTRLIMDKLTQISGARAPGRSIDTGLSGNVHGFTTPAGNIACQLASFDVTFSVDCERASGETLKPTPRKPDSCPYDWGARLHLESRSRAGFGCYSDAITSLSSVGTNWTRWYDPSQDLQVDTPWGPAAAPKPHSVIEAGSINCAVEQDSVTCRDGLDGPSFFLSSSAYRLTN